MKSFYKILALIFLSALSIYSQPQISYILPDIGAPGMNIYVEIIGPTDKISNFGYKKDTIFLNNQGDKIRVFVNDPLKADKVVIGPLVVSWGGRMISTQIFVKPDLLPTESYALSVADGFKIPIAVEVDGIVSNNEWFYIVKPYPYHNGTIANPIDVVFGEGTLGKRSPRGAIIFDSLKLGAKKYTVSMNDCDPSTTYNEAFLPFILLSKGDLIGTKSGTTYSSIDVSSVNKHAGPGGGGGGGAYCDVLFGGNDGYDGGDGFTGGGPGGENRSIGGGGSKRNWGNSTGPNLSPNKDYGGYSLNGVAGAFNAQVNFEASGGGTGHPFGISGRGTLAGNSDNPEGQYGGGSGRTQNQKGGSGGFATNGAGINISYGKEHGNPQCVPLAGGSGGGSGNPFNLVPRYCSGDGGGGGGAILAFGKSIQTIDFISNGGKGGNGNDNADGGDGSAGMIILSSKGYIDDYGLNATSGGVGGNGFGRTDRFVSRGQRVMVGGLFNGIMTDTTTYVGRNFNIMGAPYTYKYDHFGVDKNVEKLHFYMKSESGLWEEISDAAISINGGEAWVKDISLVGNDKYHYFVAVQEIPTPSIFDFKNEPSFLMTQSSANIFRLSLNPIIDTAKCTELATNDSLNCEGSSPERYFYFDIYNRADAEADLEVLSANIWNYDVTNFTIILPNKPIKPGTKETVIVKYTYQGTETNDFWCNIRIKTNDPIAKLPKYRTDSTFYGVINIKKIEIPKLEAISSNPANYIFDDTRTGQSNNLEVTYKNTGNAKLLISAIADVFPPSFFVIQKPNLPLLLLPNDEFKITLQFKPANAGTISGKISINTVNTDTTCAFSNQINVSGKALQSSVELSKLEMDFGNIPWCKIVNDSVRILNPAASSVPFSITDFAVIEGIDKDVFIITSNIQKIPLVLTPADGAMIKVRFDPSLNKSKEDFQAELVIKTNEPDNLEIRILLKGKTAHFKMASIPPSILINNAFVGFDTTYTFEILNSGLLAEYLRTNNPIEYKNSFITKIVNSPNVINPGEKRTASFISNPTTTFMNDELWVIFDTPCDDTLKIPVTINALTTTYSLETDGSFNLVNEEIDFGKISPCETNINLNTFTNMKWKNLGNAPFIVLDEKITDSDGGIFVSQPSSSLINDTIYPAKPDRVGLNFNLNIDINTPDGTYTGKYEATIYVNGKVEKKNIILKVQVEKGKFVFSENTLDLQHVINLVDSKIFKFTNSGPWNLTINNVTGPNSANGFTLSPSVVGKVYAANSFEDFIVTFTPTEVKDYRDSIVFDLTFGNCTDQYVIYLNGKGLPSKEISLNLPKVVVSPALDNYKLPIYASLGKVTDEVEGFKLDTVEISFNRSLYYPEKISNGKILSSYINNARRHIILEIDNIKFKGQNVVLTELTGYTMLGDVTKTDLKFEKISHKQSSIVSKMSSEDGSLEIEICQEGGDRLLKHFSSAAKIDIIPNPAENNAIANVFMLENGEYTLEITNITGIVIQKIHFNKNDGDNPEKFIDLNLEYISSGVYTVILTTPTAKLSKMISVVK